MSGTGYSKAVFDDPKRLTWKCKPPASLSEGASRETRRFGSATHARRGTIRHPIGRWWRASTSVSTIGSRCREVDGTFLRFSSGSAIAEDGDKRRIQALGSAALAHQIGRTWIAQIEYRRGIRHVEGFDRPLLSDSAAATVKGLATRRLELSITTSYLAGTVGLSPGSPDVDSYAASGRVRTALSRTLAAYVEYLFYHYQFAEGAVRPLGVPEKLNRQGARIGLILFVPVIE